MNETDIQARLTEIEARLAEISAALTDGGLVDRMDGILKAQLLLGALTESGQEAIHRQIAEILPGAVAARLDARIEAEMTALAARVTAAIGEALGDRDHAALMKNSAEQKPLEAILDALDLLEEQRDPARTADSPLAMQIARLDCDIENYGSRPRDKSGQ